MQKIGYSMVDASGQEIAVWGDVANQERAVPDYINWPNGDRTHCPEIGMTHAGCRFVERWLVQGTDNHSIIYDGNIVIVSRPEAQ